MAEKGKPFDWISGMSSRTQKAYRPDPFASILQSFSKGMVGRKIAQDELRKAIMTAMLGTHRPMAEGVPATPEQIATDIRGKPGVIANLLGAKEQPKLTWEPLPIEYKPRTKEELIEIEKAKRIEPKEIELAIKEALLDQKYELEKQLTELKAELAGPLNEATRRLKEAQAEQIEENTKFWKEPEKGGLYKPFIRSITNRVLKIIGAEPITETPETPETPPGQLDLGLETPTPTETLIPDWLPEEVKVRIKALQDAGASEEEIQAAIDYYRR